MIVRVVAASSGLAELTERLAVTVAVSLAVVAVTLAVMVEGCEYVVCGAVAVVAAPEVRKCIPAESVAGSLAASLAVDAGALVR